jgi:hypothetical protein
MAIRDKIRANAAHVVRPDEQIQAVIPAQITSGWMALISYWIIIIRGAYRVIVVTDRRILVCKSGRMRMTPVNEVLREVPRATIVGPPSGLWYRTESLGETLYIHKRFQKDIREADALAGVAGPAPIPPQPA